MTRIGFQFSTRKSLFRIISASRAMFAATLLLLTFTAAAQQHSRVRNSVPAPTASSVQFIDVTSDLGIHFTHQASPTTQKYLVETMGAGVALFDCDGDGRLDIFFVNGAQNRRSHPEGYTPRQSWAEILESPLPSTARRYFRRRDGKIGPRRRRLWDGSRGRRL